jgi:UDP-2,3-diacylglucosamine hydrolase
MSHSPIEIKEGAFVISDAHYSHLRRELLGFIKAIHSKELQPTQLIFMGDIFDALFGGVKYTQDKNREMIELIQEISLHVEVIYLEGNHDFNLQAIFSNIKIFTIKQQPLLAIYQDKKVYLAHGDFNGAFGYRFYTALIRNRGVLYILNHINNMAGNFILKKLDSYLNIKDDCKEFTGFQNYIEKRVGFKYSCDFFIEGHFHQNRTLKLQNFRYINLAAFACNQRYFIVKSLQDKELLEENIFSKGIE